MNSLGTAKAALSQSVEDDKVQIEMVEASRRVLTEIVVLELPDAVAEGIKAAMTKEAAREFAMVFLEVMKEQASVKVDSWAGNLVKGFFSKIWDNFWLIVLACSIAYSVGGFAAVASLAKWALKQAVAP